jgi:hypothetical protein
MLAMSANTLRATGSFSLFDKNKTSFTRNFVFYAFRDLEAIFNQHTIIVFSQAKKNIRL